MTVDGENYQMTTTNWTFENSTTNGSSSSIQQISSGNNSFRTALIILQSLIFSVSLAGNIITLVALAFFNRRRKKISRMYLFIIHLCIADLSVAILNVGPNLCFLLSIPNNCPLEFNHASCKIVHYFSIVAIYGSTYVLVMTAIDRLLVICYPLWAQRLADRHVHLMVILAWFLSLIFSVPQLVTFEFRDNACQPLWHDDIDIHTRYTKMYMIWFTTAVWIVPCIIIAICYISITVRVWSSSKTILSNGAISAGASGVARTRLIKPVQLTLAVVIGYLACWSPWMVDTLYLYFNPHAHNKSKSKPNKTCMPVG